MAAGKKGFEVRTNDRPYKVGDFLALNEWKDKEYTELAVFMKIVYIQDNPQYCKEGYVVLGLSPCAIRTKGEHEDMQPFEFYGGIPVYGKNRS